MITQNQIDPIVQSAVNRPATDFEVSQFSTASPQTIANLPNYYSGLNKDNSITDYLKYIGEDPSLENRIKLGQQYGIDFSNSKDNYATENTALLNALKTGKKATTTPTSLTGTISGANPTKTTDNSLPLAGNQISTNQPTGIPQGGDQTVAGSVSGAANSTTAPIDPNNIDTNPDVVQARKIENDAYTQQQSLQQQIADIDNTMKTQLQAQKDDISRSGGVVDEAQLQSIVTEANAPLLNQRRDLVTQYTQANNAYQKAVADRKDTEANFYKSANLAQGEEKIGQSQEKINNQTSQFTQKEQDVATKLEQSGYKLANTTDEFGNKTNYWTKNPGDTSGYNSSGQPVSISTDTQGNTTVTPQPAATNTDSSNPNNLSVAQYGLLANVKDFNPDNELDKDAYTYLTNYLSGTGGGTSSMTGGKTLQLKSDIQDRAQALYEEATGQKIPTAQDVSNANTQITNNTGLLNQLSVQTGTIQQNFGLDLSNLTANNVNTSAPIINNIVDFLANASGSTSVAQYLSQNQTLQNELASLLSVKNASGTTVADKLSSATVLPDGASIDQAKTILSTLMQEAQNQSNTILQTNAENYIKVDGLGLNPQNPVNNTIILTDANGNPFQFDPNSLTPQQLQDAFDSGYTLTSQQ